MASQCCAWVRRSVNLDEFWKRELFFLSYGSVFNIRKKEFCPIRNPILSYIAGCFKKFIFCFTATDENFLKSFIFENPCLPFQQNRNNYLKEEFFGVAEYAENKQTISSLSITHLVNSDFSLKTHHEFEALTTIVITGIKFNVLQGLARTAINQFRKQDQNQKRNDSVQNFCMRIKRGSKKYRKILTGTVPDIISTNITCFAEIIDQVINLESSKRLNQLWRWNFFDNSPRTFIFKLHNNLLGINTRVAHFVRNHSFCSLHQVPEDFPETILHLFFDFNCVEGLV